MLNFLGLGFSMGAQDKGLAASLKNTTAGLMDISKSVIGIGMASAKMAFKPPNFGPSVALAQSLANDVKLTTTATEAFGIASSKVTAAGLAGLNMTDKQLSKAKGKLSGIAYSTNMDIGSLTKSFASLTQAGIDTNNMSEYGFSSFTEFSKVMEVTGADAGQMASSMGMMGKQMGMSKAQIKDSITAVAAIGKKFNIGREAIAGMSDTVKMLNENSNKLPQNWSPAKMGAFLKGTTAVSGALASVGFSAEDSMAASKNLSSMLLKSNEGIGELYSGLANVIPGGMDFLNKQLGSAEDSFALLQESPEKFLSKMGGLVDSVKGMNLDDTAMMQFRLSMGKTFGPELLATFDKGLNTMKPALESAGKAVEGQSTVIKSLAKGYEDGLLPSEKFTRAQDQMHYKLKQVKGVMSDGQYLKKYKENTDKVVSTVEDLAAKGGVLGKATTMFVEFSNHGVGGALAAHTEWGLAMSEGMKLMEPMMQYLPAMGAAFKALSSPIGMVVGGMGALYFLFKDLDKGKDSVVGPMLKKFIAEAPAFIKKIGEFAKDMFSTMYSVLSKVDWDSVFKTVTDAAFTVFSAIGDVIASVNWGKVFEVVASVISKVIDVVFDILGKINWAGIAESVSNAFKMIFSTIFAVIDKIDWNKVGQVLGVILSKAAEIAVDLLGAAFKLGEKLLMWLDGIDWAGMGKKIGGYLMDALGIIYTAAIRVIENLPQIIWTIFKKAADFICGAFDGVKEWLMEKFPKYAKPIFIAFEAIKVAVRIVQVAFGAFFGYVGELIKEYIGAVKKVIEFTGDVANAVIDFFSSSDDDSISQAMKEIGRQSSMAGKEVDNSALSISELIAKQQEAIIVAQKRHTEWVTGEHLAGRATEGFTKTVEGTIKLSTDTFVRYEKDAMGTIKSVAHDAGVYVKGEIGGAMSATMDDFLKKTEEIIQARNKMGLKGKELHNQELKDAEMFSEMRSDFSKQYGMDMQESLDMRSKIMGAYSIEKSTMEEIMRAGEGYADAVKEYQKNIGEETMNSTAALNKQRDAGKMSADEYLYGLEKIKIATIENKKALDEFVQVTTDPKGVQNFFDHYTVGGIQAIAAIKAGGGADTAEYKKREEEQRRRVSDATRVAALLTSQYAGQIDAMTKTFPERSGAMADAVKTTMEKIAKSHELEMKDFLANTNLRGDAFKAEQERITAEYAKSSIQVQKIISDESMNINAGILGNATSLLNEMNTKMEINNAQVSKRAKENATDISESFKGISADTALASIKDIGGMDPDRFKKNMNSIKNSFINFLDVMDAKGKVIMTNTNKSFDTMWTTMSTGWAKNQKVLEDFSVSADKFFTKFWQMLVDKATKFAGEIIDVTKNIETSLNAMSKSINLMDLLASPDQINQWAASVVSALSYAFMDGKAADAMISASYNRALMMAGEFAKTGAATPESITANQPSPNSSATSSAAMQATLNLVNAIHDPKWANDPKKPIPLALAEMNKNLENALAAMKGVADSRATASRGGKPTSRVAPKG